MKKLILLMLVSIFNVEAMLAGGASSVMRSIYLVGKHPEESLSFIGFLIDLFIMCIPVSIIAGIVCLILRSVLNWDKEETKNAFLTIGGILLGIFLLVYFLV